MNSANCAGGICTSQWIAAWSFAFSMTQTKAARVVVPCSPCIRRRNHRVKRSRSCAKATLTVSASQAVCVKFSVTKWFRGVPIFSARRMAGLMLVACWRRMKVLRLKYVPPLDGVEVPAIYTTTGYRRHW